MTVETENADTVNVQDRADAANQFNATVAKRLLASRQAKSMTRKDLHALSGIHWDTIRRIEVGERQIQLVHLHAICGALNQDPAAIVADNFAVTI
jgi:DNA-binding Xre family transcriptional regulator